MQEEIQKIQWHPAFYSGIELELIKYKGKLHYESEHQLSREPLRMDLLIIKKDTQTVIEDEIGRIFRGHNIVEYKSPGDRLTQDDVYKTLGYAYLYKGLGATPDEIPAGELTVSIFREGYPREMFAALAAQGALIEEKYPGIYYVTGLTATPTQIIVTGRLSKAHPVLRILSDKVTAEDVQRFAEHTRGLSDPGDRNNIDAVLKASISANERLFREMRKGAQEMSSAVKEILYDIWEEEIEEAEARGEVRGEARGEARGKEIGMQETLYSLVHDGLLPVASGAARANLTEAAFMENMKKLYSPETGG